MAVGVLAGGVLESALSNVKKSGKSSVGENSNGLLETGISPIAAPLGMEIIDESSRTR
jgi:hypothetical protein